MLKSALLCALLSTVVYSQYDRYDRNYTVMDIYYKTYIQIEDTASSVNQKINNPGLYKNSVSRCGIGLLKQFNGYYGINENYLESNSVLNDLYAWTELKTDIGNFGGYVGNMSLNNNSVESISSYETKIQNSSLSAAIWFNPASKSFFKGISIFADGNYSYDKSNSNIQYGEQNSKSKKKDINIKAVSLFQLSDKLHLKWGIAGSKYKFVYNSSYNEDSYYYNNVTYIKNENRHNYGDMNVGLIANKCFDLTLGAEVNATNQKDTSILSTYNGLEYTDLKLSDNAGSGFFAFYLNCALEKIIYYRKHKVYLGIVANIKANLYDNDDDYYKTFRDVMKNVKKDQRHVTTNILCPVTMDINLFNLPLFAVVSVVPALNAYMAHGKLDGQKYESSACDLNMSQFAFGLKGKIGEKVEFSLIPSIQSNIFIGGAEVNYAFGKSKT